MKKQFSALLVISAIALVGCTPMPNDAPEDDPQRQSKTAAQLAQLCPESVAAAAADDGLLIVVEEDFSNVAKAFTSATDVVQRCLQNIVGSDLPPQEVVFEVADSSVEEEQPSGGNHPTELAAVY